jgi:hypothetical protein
MPGPEIFLAIAVLRLGVQPSFFIKNNITASVAVLNPPIKHAHRQTNPAPIGANSIAYKSYAMSFKIDNSKLITKLKSGAALMKNPYGMWLLSNWKIIVLNK